MTWESGLTQYNRFIFTGPAKLLCALQILSANSIYTFHGDQNFFCLFHFFLFCQSLISLYHKKQILLIQFSFAMFKLINVFNMSSQLSNSIFHYILLAACVFFACYTIVLMIEQRFLPMQSSLLLLSLMFNYFVQLLLLLLKNGGVFGTLMIEKSVVSEISNLSQLYSPLVPGICSSFDYSNISFNSR